MASPDTITGYHAHVYYDAESKETAARLRAQIEDGFEIEMGRWHDHPVGPHPIGSYQVAFSPTLFGDIVPWLAMNHGRLTVFIHPLTGDVVREHTENALWLGREMEIDVSFLERIAAERSEKAGKE